MTDIYGLDEAAGRWRQAAATLGAEVLASHAAEVDAQARFPAEGMAALAQGGFYGLCLGTPFGGHGQGLGVLPQSSRSWQASAHRRRWFM